MRHYSERSVLSIATGKPVYIEMAVNLARSFIWWHKNSSIQFVLATDRKDLIPHDLSDIQVIELLPGQFGQGFSPKLYLDQLSTAQQTLFLDADCLCFGSLDSVFDCFEGHSVSVVGDTISQGEFFGNVSEICQRFQIKELPRFVGGLYYLEKSEVSTRVFTTARDLESNYDENGLVRLRGLANEEPLIAIAMALNEQKPVPDNGSIKAETMCFPSGVKADVFRGISYLWNQIQDRKDFPTWVHLAEAHPLIIHFNGSYTENHPYTREAIRLQKVLADGWSIGSASAYAFTTCSIPQITGNYVRHILRPVYRKIFGVRSISKSQRI